MWQFAVLQAVMATMHMSMHARQPHQAGGLSSASWAVQLCSQLSALSAAQAEGAASADLEQQLQEVLQLMTAGGQRLASAAWQGLAARLQQCEEDMKQAFFDKVTRPEADAPGGVS
ncbi:hypothetical protein HaLaN_29030 [Haematococcus lacustris]|uniref:Uncharacterized protein n=1 Tax=Haematococcus lacustris TaxID=44745 RepID=A0A6A0ACW6_HAELA|nr:hypothetical protein HaLaN_29030 [Haematococcus lacustris]